MRSTACFLGQRVLRPDAGGLRRLGRLDVERLLHLPLDLVALRDEALEPLFDAREILAEAAQGFGGEPLRLVGLAIARLRLGEGVGGGAMRASRRRGDLGRRAPRAARSKPSGASFDRVELRAEIGEALVERRDLRLGAVAPALPVGDVAGDLAQPAMPQLRRGLERAELQPRLLGIGARSSSRCARLACGSAAASVSSPASSSAFSASASIASASARLTS